MTRAMRVVVALLGLVLMLAPPMARAAEPVDLLLVLAVLLGGDTRPRRRCYVPSRSSIRSAELREVGGIACWAVMPAS